MFSGNAERLVELFVVAATLVALALADPVDPLGADGGNVQRIEVASPAGLQIEIPSSSLGPVSDSLATMARTIGILDVVHAPGPRRTRC